MTVSGLQEPVYVDAFEPGFFDSDSGVYVNVYGECPFAFINFYYRGPASDPRAKVTYTCTDENGNYAYGFMPGDTVMIRAELNMPEPYALREDTYYYVIPENTAHYFNNSYALSGEYVGKMLDNAISDFENPYFISMYYSYSGGEFTKYGTRSIKNVRTTGKIYFAMRNDVKDEKFSVSDARSRYSEVENAVLIPVRFEADPYDWVTGLRAKEVWGVYVVENAGLDSEGRFTCKAAYPAGVAFSSEAEVLDYIRFSRYDSTRYSDVAEYSGYDTDLFDFTELSA